LRDAHEVYGANVLVASKSPRWSCLAPSARASVNFARMAADCLERRSRSVVTQQGQYQPERQHGRNQQ
jgi:hypothetical protein